MKNETKYFVLGFLFFSSTYLSAQEITGAASEKASFQINFTQSSSINDQVNVISTAQGLMPLRQDMEGYYVSGIERIPIKNATPFITLGIKAGISNYDPAIVSILVRFSSDEVVWSAWEEITVSHDTDPTNSSFFGNMIFIDTVHQYFSYMIEFRQASPASPVTTISNIKFDFFSPGDVTPLNQTNISGLSLPGVNTSCGCDLPTYATRDDWECPDGNSPSCSSPVFAPVSHMIVHHSAGINSSDNWAAVVLSIWNLHVNTNNWCDIGYNWLIDPNGVIYEGRGGGNNVRGAHFCGANSGTMGVCLLGNFENASPTAEALASLTDLLTWKSCDASIDPLGISLHQSSNINLKVISGHQEGCSTVCPGANLFNELPTLRGDVQNALSACESSSTRIGNFIETSFNIFPNPSNGAFMVSWESGIYEKAELKISNNLGQLVHCQDLLLYAGKHEAKIESGLFAPGMYQVLVITTDKIISRNLVVENR